MGQGREIQLLFQEHFGYPAENPVIVRAPGRVNLIGEHIDYNDGSVMPIAIDRHAKVLAMPSLKPGIRAFSELYNEDIQWGAEDRERISSPSWGNYVKGVFVQLLEKGLIGKGDFDKDSGIDIYIAGDIPPGAGLSSSAALEVACAYAMLLHTAPWLAGSREIGAHFEIAKLCMLVEHEFAGVKCGLMDQVSAIFSRKDEVMIFDTRYNTISYAPFFQNCQIAIIDSRVPRSLSDSRYNTRREECGQALESIREYLGAKNVRSWRDLSSGLLAEMEGAISYLPFRRALHIVSEIERVGKASLALERGDKKYFGRLMNKSHESLRFNFEVSVPEIDLLQNIAARLPGVYGARLCGAGFGGCVIALVEQGNEENLEVEIKRRYKAVTEEEPSVMFTKPSSGVVELLNQPQK